MSATELEQRADRKVGAAHLLKLPVYFLDAETLRRHGVADADVEWNRLALVCEQHFERAGRGEAVFSAAQGIYLVVRSATGAEADGIAERLGSAILESLVDAERSADDQPMFRRVPAPDERSTRPETAEPSAAPSPPAIPVEATKSNTAAGSRDRFSELAMRGVLTGQNVELIFKPVHDLVRGRSTTLFCTPAFCVAGSPVITGYRAFEGVNEDEWPVVDRAILAHALKFARRLGQAGVYVAVGAPINFQTLVRARGREMYCEALRAAGVPEYPFVVLMIHEVPLGTTASKLAEIVGALRPLSKRLFVKLPNIDTALLSSGHLSADGFILSLPAQQRPTQVAAADWLAKMCETQTALSCIDQIENEGSLEIVRAAAIRFGQGTAFGSTEFRGDAVPIDVEAFLRNAARGAGGASHRDVQRLGLHKGVRSPAHRLN